ncbi:MAG TPA: sulfatase-like hydrolase/transferase [Burkholderiaceae bacterium]
MCAKPLVLVVVVGETARAANWGLNGCARQTTPQRERLGVVNFSDVRSCGTNTEVSLPCMFAPVGRRDCSEARIRGSESLLHVLARAGVAVHWRDNQSGCKGVCDGLPNDTVSAVNAPGLCQDGRCLDEGLIHDLDQRLESAKGAQLMVLHQPGNHGPSYFRRYPPPAFARHLPECRDDDLRRCSVEEIVNAYDNAILYTDHLLASTIAKLAAHADKVDSVLLYVSDHGESLGEKGLFLHGVPWAIGPDEQTKVPMVMWWSRGLAKGTGVGDACMRATLVEHARQKTSHDHLFHTVLHAGGRALAALALVVLAADLFRSSAGAPARAQRAYWFAVIALALLPALKRLSLSSCPWDLAEFGGTAAYVPHGLPGTGDGGPGHCFPSGHAVSAFAFFGLYFL